MRSGLREALARQWKLLWGDETRPGVLRRLPEKSTVTVRSAEDRARFWAEFRAGQREAAERSRP
jgi:hypothetical protein